MKKHYWFMVAVSLLAVLANTANGQATAGHTPGNPVVDGDKVTIDGSICWHAETIKSEIYQGSTLTLPGIFANSGGNEPIIIKMPPGTHSITILGFPDPGTNVRNAVVKQVTVGQPTRKSQLVDAYKNIEKGKNLWRLYNEKVDEIKPTRVEAIEALQAIGNGE